MNLESNLGILISIGVILTGIFGAMFKLFKRSEKIDLNSKDLLELKKMTNKAILKIEKDIRDVKNSEIKELQDQIKSMNNAIHEVEKNITALISTQYEKILDRENNQNINISKQFSAIMDKIANIQQGK